MSISAYTPGLVSVATSSTALDAWSTEASNIIRWSSNCAGRPCNRLFSSWPGANGIGNARREAVGLSRPFAFFLVTPVLDLFKLVKQLLTEPVLHALFCIFLRLFGYLFSQLLNEKVDFSWLFVKNIDFNFFILFNTNCD
jgi:hypothetical protein